MATKASPKPKTSKNTTSSLDVKNKGTAKKTTTKKTVAQRYNLSGKTNTAVSNVKNQYAGYQNTYNSNVDKQSASDIASSNAMYQQNAQNAALRNAVQQRQLQRQMYRNGITGGASETSMMNAANNYANQQGKIASDKVTAANTIRQKAQASKDAYALQNAQARDTAEQQARDRVYNQYQNWLKRKDTQAQQRFENKMSKRRLKNEEKQTKLANQEAKYTRIAAGYSSLKAINKKIKNTKNKVLKSYLKRRRSEIKEANREWKYKYKALNK